MFYLEILALFFILFVLYETSNSLKYYVKFLFYYGGVIFNSFLLVPYFITRPANVLNLITASKFCCNISKIIGLTWILRGAEHLRKDQACVIICNHQSSLDILGMFDIWPVMNKTTVVAKRELLYIWPFGLCAYLCGLVFIDRYATDKAKNTMNQAMERLKRNKIKLWIFPEGTRRNTGTIHEFKKGAFNVAVQAQVPIVPVVVSSYRSFLDSKLRVFDSSEVIIEALPEISTKGLSHDDISQLMQRSRQLMIEKFNENTQEIELKNAQRLKKRAASGNVHATSLLTTTH